jgi:hypothetical protein
VREEFRMKITPVEETLISDRKYSCSSGFPVTVQLASQGVTVNCYDGNELTRPITRRIAIITGSNYA